MFNMGAARGALARIRRELGRGHGPAIFLDFDGTLASIVPHPSDAHMPKRTKLTLQSLAKRFPVVVISGRDLEDIEARIGIPDIACAGGHGLEWTFGGKHHVKHPGTSELEALASARRALIALASSFEGVVIEDKHQSFALNYRRLSGSKAAVLRRDARATIAAYQQRLRILDELATFEVLPKIGWTKGECALAILREFEHAAKKRYLPVYLGDSATDEDAFRSLRRGVTIKIGPGKTTAGYRILRTSVREFLSELQKL